MGHTCNCANFAEDINVKSDKKCVQQGNGSQDRLHGTKQKYELST